ncbi:hypothetical protein BAU17_03560 [Enterococcus sp. CU12B]|uniref:Uncharacterized protein n=1 Tax=Candidatus Enterococcus willemsii TaxID=1857215 RepID=A0ABQ6Z2X4_9ENTE|nr:hypothetical protein BAU17_03560 [Enterococcus sp. CU12B]
MLQCLKKKHLKWWTYDESHQDSLQKNILSKSIFVFRGGDKILFYCVHIFIMSYLYLINNMENLAHGGHPVLRWNM